MKPALPVLFVQIVGPKLKIRSIQKTDQHPSIRKTQYPEAMLALHR